MKYIVEQNLSMWIHYSKYEIRICQGIAYIIPAQDAYPRPYNMQKKKEEWRILVVLLHLTSFFFGRSRHCGGISILFSKESIYPAYFDAM